MNFNNIIDNVWVDNYTEYNYKLERITYRIFELNRVKMTMLMEGGSTSHLSMIALQNKIDKLTTARNKIQQLMEIT